MEHFHSSKTTSASSRASILETSAFASTQAAWRFYANSNITLSQLAKPLLQEAGASLLREPSPFALVCHDGSNLIYSTHTSKKDQIPLGNATGYDLQTSLLISAVDGYPIAPICQSLRFAEGICSTRSSCLLPYSPFLDVLSNTIDFLERQPFSKQLVHLIDREGDSVFHYRQFEAKKRLFLIRANDSRYVRYQDQEQKLSQVVKDLIQKEAFHFSQDVEVHGKKGKQFVAETKVTLDREAQQDRLVEGKRVQKRIKGKAISLRLVVSRILGEDGVCLAEWLLFTNVKEVSAETLAQWYYWRWKIESLFKLLKTEGFNLEEWQQEKASALAKRLLVVSMAVTLVWNLKKNPDKEAQAFCHLLVRLSGKQMKRSKPITDSALLTGILILLPMLELLETHDLQEIRTLAKKYILPENYIR